MGVVEDGRKDQQEEVGEGKVSFEGFETLVEGH